MPIMQKLLLEIPSSILGLIVVGGAVALTIAGLLVVRRFAHHSRLRLHHDVADPILGVMGAVYSVLIAFVVVTVWISLDKSSANVHLEANYLADLYRDSEGLSPNFRSKVAPLLREYREVVINYEWKAMQRGEMSPEVEKIINRIWALYVTYVPRNNTEQVFFEESIRKLNSFRELRRTRLMDSRNGINPLLWLILIGGALTTVSFTFLFGAESLKAQLIMGILLSATIGLILFAIMAMDFPFTGSISVSAEPFQRIILD
jgi:AraC-like DNA-binding protein